MTGLDGAGDEFSELCVAVSSGFFLSGERDDVLLEASWELQQIFSMESKVVSSHEDASVFVGVFELWRDNWEPFELLGRGEEERT